MKHKDTQLQLRLTSGQKELIRRYAERKETSMSAYILNAVWRQVDFDARFFGESEGYEFAIVEEEL